MHPEMKKALAIINNAEPQYTFDAKGRRVRVFTKELPCTEQDVVMMCLNTRALSEDDVLETVGKHVFQYMVKKDYLRKAHGDLYYVTQACQKAYKLPNPRLVTGTRAKYIA